MSWLPRLFRKTPPPAAVLPPANSVVIADDIAAELASDPEGLSAAVEGALRAHLAAAKHPKIEIEKLPFWLQRELLPSGDLEDELRERVNQRHSNEAGN